MAPSTELPEKVARHNSAFVDATVRLRLPEILRSIQPELVERGCAQKVWAMYQALTHEGALDTNFFSHAGPFWQRYFSEMSQPTWRALPFFDLEILFYHAINSLTGYWKDEFDVFGRIKTSALESAVATESAVLERALLESDARAVLWTAVHCALLGNQADLSQLDYLRGASAAQQSGLLLDECDQLLDQVLEGSADSIHILLDNAGAELCFDLVLADVLLRFTPAQVVLHAKPCPMFVSDARPSDVERTIGAFQRSSPGLAACGQRLERARREGRLVLVAEPDWGEARDFSNLSEQLVSELNAADLVIAKGDLNYRRFVGDRWWPVDTPAHVATVGVSFRAFCLRVLKSDVMVGLDADTIKRAVELDFNWRTDGKFAVIQRL